ncbi:MAG: hypothetical protein P4L55_08605 [Syntrophobacteraceae bacterium]|nr:hypothetical protein [Syntrophobacteraceae bacterium]
MRSRFALVPILALLLILGGGGVSTCKAQYVVSRTYIIRYVIDPKQIDYVVNLFKNSLSIEEPTAGIIGCKLVTRVAQGGGKDFAIGAACAVQSGENRFSVLMCEDSRFGRLVRAPSRAPARGEVIQFIEDNCLPAGKR